MRNVEPVDIDDFVFCVFLLQQLFFKYEKFQTMFPKNAFSNFHNTIT